ncbi:MAG: DUF5818 domain-containing protein [Sphingomonas phyllosphaerae]
MPRATRHILIGTLRRTRSGYALEKDRGVVWQLDVDWLAARRLCGRRVRIEGKRLGFDLIDVRRMTPAKEPAPNQPDRRQRAAEVPNRMRTIFAKLARPASRGRGEC